MNILIIDDEASLRRTLRITLETMSHHVAEASDAASALTLLGHRPFDLAFLDLRLGGEQGLDLLPELLRLTSGLNVVVITAYATVTSAVEAMRRGAFDYIEKPFDVDQLEQLVSRAMRHGRMLDQGDIKPDADAGGPTMIGGSEPMRSLRTRIAQVAPTSETVLITGESGTGKELVAQAVHAASLREQQSLVSLNCPVLSAHLMESELFGHERGAFTGADTRRTGRFELAHCGTILLDEITEIDLGLQAKLLRVLQERRFERVGSSQTIDVDVRVLATTNRDLRAEIVAGRFREDLFFRLNVVPLSVPPLRDRQEDVPVLAQHFLLQTARRLGKDSCELEPAANELLLEYHWPGNVRELENLMTRASVLNLGLPIAADELRPWLIAAPGVVPAPEQAAAPVGVNLREMERQLIEATLERFNGHRAQTAQALGIGIRTLSGKLKEYGYAPRTKNFTKRMAG